MDRFRKSTAEHCTAMCAGRRVTLRPLLRTSGRDERESGTHASFGRAVYADAVLRDPEDAPLASQSGLPGQREAGKEASAENGFGGNLRKTAFVDAVARPSTLSIPITRIADCAAQSGLGNRHNLYPHEARLCLPGSGDGLVQSLCSVLGAIGHVGRKLLPNGTAMGIKTGPARHFQFGSGLPIYERAVYRAAPGQRYRNQHGWPRSSAGQHLRGALVANDKIRRGLFERLRGCPGSGRKSSTLFSVLQSRTVSPILGLSNPGTGLFPEGGFIGKTGHDNDRVAMRSSSVGHYSANLFSKNEVKPKIAGNEPIESLEKP